MGVGQVATALGLVDALFLVFVVALVAGATGARAANAIAMGLSLVVAAVGVRHVARPASVERECLESAHLAVVRCDFCTL